MKSNYGLSGGSVFLLLSILLFSVSAFAGTEKSAGWLGAWKIMGIPWSTYTTCIGILFGLVWMGYLAFGCRRPEE